MVKAVHDLNMVAFFLQEMDVSESSMRGDVDCRKPRLIHTSETPVSHHNGHPSTINLSYQVF